MSENDVSNIIESKFHGQPVDSYQKTHLDAEGHKITMFFEKLRLTFQAIDMHDFASMEVVLQRCIKEKPHFVVLPLVGTNAILRSQDQVDDHM